MAMDDLGLPSPNEFPDRLQCPSESSSDTLWIAPQIPSDDPVSTFDNPSAHMIILHDGTFGARGGESLIPIIHW